MLLYDMPIGEVCKIDFITLNNNAYSRLLTLGMTKGAKVEMLNKSRHGSVIIKLRGSRLALGKYFSHKIIVSK